MYLQNKERKKHKIGKVKSQQKKCLTEQLSYVIIKKKE